VREAVRVVQLEHLLASNNATSRQLAGQAIKLGNPFVQGLVETNFLLGYDVHYMLGIPS